MRSADHPKPPLAPLNLSRSNGVFAFRLTFESALEVAALRAHFRNVHSSHSCSFHFHTSQLATRELADQASSFVSSITLSWVGTSKSTEGICSFAFFCPPLVVKSSDKHEDNYFSWSAGLDSRCVPPELISTRKCKGYTFTQSPRI